MVHTDIVRRVVVAVLLGLAAPALADDRQADGPTQKGVQIVTVDGNAVDGTIVGGTLSIRTAAGVRAFDARHITTFTGTLLKQDNGPSFMGSIEVAGGEVLVRTARGEVAVPARTIRSIQSGEVLAWASPTSPSPEGAEQGSLTKQTLLGRWRDSSGVTWEFLDDGTVIFQQMSGRYRLAGPNRLAIEFQEFLLGIQGARVYDILSASDDLIVWAYQGSRAKLVRQR